MSTHPNNPNRHFTHYKQKLKFKADNGDEDAAFLLGRKKIGVKLTRAEQIKNKWKDPVYRKKCLVGLAKARAARRKEKWSFEQQVAIMISQLGIELNGLTRNS